VLLAALLAFAVPSAALAAFPGTDPSESPRVNTPNDPGFDPCEGDDPDTAPPRCTSYFEEQFGSFGFSPDSANEAPGVHTQYVDCSQLDQQGRDANVAAGDPACSQIAGVRADTAWKYSAGSPKVAVAILDTGIRWQSRELVDKVHLNRGELPVPQHGDGSPCGTYDCNGDGAFNVEDYADDPRVHGDAGDSESDSILDGSDLIATFSNGTDADSNGYVDDIAGWDFFDDDNDPFDASSCCSAGGHGSGRASEAVAQTDNGLDDTGMCPGCQLMPLRIWDSFVPPTDNWAMALTYATDNGASVAEGAIGGLSNTLFARNAVRYADNHGVALMLVSSDINSANHNYPTNYNEAVYVAGSLPDTAPNDTCSGPGGLPGFGDLPSPPGFDDGCQQFLGLLADQGITPTAQPTTTSFFRNSNLTQYGGKADIVLMGSTGSENTGQAAGAAGLLESYARERFAGTQFPAGLTGNETRQLLTMTAEDVLPANTGQIGLADKANPGWDPHFGYGRVDLAAAMERISTGRIPPEAQINAPAWFAPIDVNRVPASGVPITGYTAAPHSSSGVGSWSLEWACGQDAPDSKFKPISGASGTGPISGSLGAIPRTLLQNLAANCNGSVKNDPGRPAGTADQPWPVNPYPEPDPERHAFQIRLVVHEADHPTNVGQYRKTLFAYDDDGNLAGWPRPIGTGSVASAYITGSGGETSTRLYDVDGDNRLDVLLGTSGGELYALNSDGTPVAGFNGGHPVRTRVSALAKSHPPDASLPLPREPLRVPAIGDIDGDREADIVATAGEHVYAWHLDGSPVSGFPVRLDPALSDPCNPGAPHPCFNAADRAITEDNHIKRGFLGSAALADLDGDGRLDIVAGALDQHLYGWDGAGHSLPGFPVKLSSPDAPGAEIITTPAIAQLDGTGPPEVIVATNEVVPGDPHPPGTIFDIFDALVGSSTGSNPVYAVHGDGSMVSGWPVMVGVLAGDLLPMVLPGNDAAVLDQNGDGSDDVVVSAATSLTDQGPKLVNGSGGTERTFQSGPADSPDQGPIVNLADYPSIGDLSGDGSPDVLKGGITLNGVANLLAVNQNLPFSHVEQAWDSSTGSSLPSYPRATDDFQLLSQAAVARVGGTGKTRQALVGTGLYQVHAYGPTGDEPSGWPKFTGGWIESTPAVGDANGDGKLDVSAVTREGWSFLWHTGVGTCAASNDEWWTFHHDERSTANYGTDARPPGTPRVLHATRAADGSVTASWKQPGDDWLCGRPALYRVIASPDPIEHAADGRQIAKGVPTDPAGTSVSRTLAKSAVGSARYLAVQYRDEAGNWGLTRSTPIPAVQGG
jgi:subtilase family protein